MSTSPSPSRLRRPTPAEAAIIAAATRADGTLDDTLLADLPEGIVLDAIVQPPVRTFLAGVERPDLGLVDLLRHVLGAEKVEGDA